MLKNKKINVYISIIYFILLCIKLIYSKTNRVFIGASVMMPYVGNYQEFGFGSRMFLGSIIHFFTNYISNSLILSFTITSAIILYLILSITFKILLDKYNDKKFMVLLIYLLFLIYPFGMLFMNVWYGFVDTVCLLMYVIAIFMLNSNNKIVSKLSIIFVVMAIATHTMPFFLFGASYFIIFLYKYYCEKNDFYYVLKNFLINIILIIILLFIFQFYKKLNFANEDAIADFLSTKTDINDWKGFVHYEYFDSVIANCIKSYQGVTFIVGLSAFISCLFELPLLIFCEMFWTRCRKDTSDNNLKIVFLACILSFVPTIICFIGSDFVRWIESYFFVNFIVFINFLLHNENIVVNRFFKYKNTIFKHKKIFIACIVLLLIFNLYPDASFVYNGCVFKIVKSISRFIEWWNINIYW